MTSRERALRRALGHPPDPDVLGATDAPARAPPTLRDDEVVTTRAAPMRASDLVLRRHRETADAPCVPGSPSTRPR